MDTPLAPVTTARRPTEEPPLLDLSGLERRGGIARCRRCHGTGWADPFDVFDGSPPLTWCPACLGAALDECDGCDGYGAVPASIPCPDCDDGDLSPRG